MAGLVHLSVSSSVVLTGSSPGGERLPGRPGWGGRGGPVPARGPAGAAVMRAAARVTSRRGHTGQVLPGSAQCFYAFSPDLLADETFDEKAAIGRAEIEALT